MKIGDTVKRLYIDRKGIKHLSGQTGKIVRFTDYWGYPAAECHFFEFVHPSFTSVDHYSTELLDELETV